ncbi:MAG: hypothetical protein PHY93_03790 [Bacteriovorax sp.]|nr:hypothetical protein [Bacteriovorax sp.]
MVKIDQHDDAANFLMLVADQEKDLKETCQITPTEALNLIQPLHAMIDEEVKKGPHIITTDLEASCMANCHCGIYSDLAKSRRMKEGLFKKAQTIPKKALIACAEKTAKWFCSSKLLERLKSEVSTNNLGSPDGL